MLWHIFSLSPLHKYINPQFFYSFQSNNKLNEVENYLNKLKIELNESRIKQEELLTELNSAHLKRDQLVEDISKVLGDLSLTGNAENLSTILCNRINDLKEQM